MTTAAPRVNQKDQSILPFIFHPGPFIHSHPFVWELLFLCYIYVGSIKLFHISLKSL